MAENSKIEWTDHTFNPWWGCTPVSSACDFCYAEAWSKRFGKDLWGNKPRQRTCAQNWNGPRKWNRQAEKLGIRYRVFCASMSDVFDNQVPTEWRDDLWQLIRETPHLDWLLLTKRPQNIEKMLPADWGYGYPNVWLGTTIENQTEANRRILQLLLIPSTVRFLSCEPLLGPINLNSLQLGEQLHLDTGLWRCEYDALTGYPTRIQGDDPRTTPPGQGIGTLVRGGSVDIGPTLDWVICGGESGPMARPMHPEWARSLRDQCQAAGVAFHFKQWGEWFPLTVAGHPATIYDVVVGPRKFRDADRFDWSDGYASIRFGKKKAGRAIDGRTWDEFPKAA